MCVCVWWGGEVAADLRALTTQRGQDLLHTCPNNGAALMLVNLFTHPEAKDNNKLFRMNS